MDDLHRAWIESASRRASHAADRATAAQRQRWSTEGRAGGRQPSSADVDRVRSAIDRLRTEGHAKLRVKRQAG
jgi:hypothetical protein